MAKNIKESITILSIYISNIIIAFLITNILGISNTIIINSMSMMYNHITIEVIIILFLTLLEISIYELNIKEYEIIL